MKNLNNTGVTLLEILLASVIFIISVAGIFASLNAVRAPVATKEGALTAAVFGKQALEALRSQVSNTTYYNSNCTSGCALFDLEVGAHSVPHGSLPTGLTWPNSLLVTGNIDCDASGCLHYTVYCADGSSGPSCGGNTDIAHKVNLNINY